MAQPTNHWKLGLFVVAATMMALGAVVYLGAESFRREHVSYVTYFDESVSGLDVGSPIHFRGVKVGQVGEIGIAPDGRHVAVSLSLFTKNLHSLRLAQGHGESTRIAVPPDLRVQLVNQGITGLKAVELDFFDIDDYPAPDLGFPLPERYIPSAPSTLKKLEDSVTHAFDRFPQVADALLAVAAHASNILSDFEKAKLPQGAAVTLQEMNATLVAVRKTMADADVGGLSAQSKQILGKLDSAIGRFDRAMARVDGEQGLIASAQRTTDAIGDVAAGAPAISEEVVATLRDIQEAARSFQRLTDALERDPDMLLKGRRGDQ